MKPTPELINDWHEKARQMALQADGYFDDVEHWRHFAELAAAWGAEKARQTTDPLGFQIRRAIAAEDELRATKQTLEHAYAALQKVADAQAAIEEPELPEAAAWWCCVPGQDVCLLIDEPPDSRYPKEYKSPLFNSDHMQAFADAKVREAMAQQSADAKRWKFWRSLYDINNPIDQNVARQIERAVTPEQLDAAIDAAMKGGQQ